MKDTKCVIGALLDMEGKTVRPFCSDHFTNGTDPRPMIRRASKFVRTELMARPGDVIAWQVVPLNDRAEALADACERLTDGCPEGWSVAPYRRLVSKGPHYRERLYGPFDRLIQEIAEEHGMTMDEAADYYWQEVA